MTWKGKELSIVLSNNIYENGKKVSKDIMKIYESMIERAEGIGKWFIEINPQNCKEDLNMVIKT